MISERLIRSVRYHRQPSLTSEEIFRSLLECITEINNFDQENRDLRQRFGEFWLWYITITPAVAHSRETEETFRQLLEKETEVVNNRNKEINQLLLKLIYSISYTNTHQ